MPLFQNTVVKKYSNSLDKKILDQKWLLFTTIFHNSVKQQNIRNSKEEQYQAIFLNDLFVQVLGYTQHPNINYNLITEQKNETNSKKADGAIILNENVHAVIELKGTETTDLTKIETQAFGYKNNQKACSYVIISNFEKLRFYVDNATEYVEFNLFTLSRDEFNLLYICLSLESMQADLPKKIKHESVSSEDKITKELYKDYSTFRKELFSDIVQLNPQYNQLQLFKKTQKLLDRFLFIFFAEDRQLLPTNLIFSINLEWQKLREARIPVSLYDRYKMYFNDLNTGARVTLPAFGKHINEIITAQYDIYAYNGGLFQPDDLLDNIAINDDLLFKHTKKLSEYDFESEVDVNILGHIFENSLNEIDEITNAIEGQEIDKTKTKRKKDGVFYTPKYITKYIVDNTIGKLCEEKKVEIDLNETKYSTDKKINVATKKKLIETLDVYRSWLLQLTIVDPACGSGAFLNQALEFLIAEHKYIDELQAKLFGDALVLSDVEGSILENNLFGVDLNEESVEIAKLSLWLRTAQRNRKLNSLNNNIKCGNSLIDDAAIAGDKAFNWQNEFPKVFKLKQKKPFHITTAIHDSRTSQRMIDYKVREKRYMGTMPEPQINYLTDNDEMVIAETVAVLVKEQNLNILAFNVCKDHIHIVLVCEDEEVSEIVRKIKGRTAREVNLSNGINPIINKEFKPLVKSSGEKSIPLWTQKFGCQEIVDENHLSNCINYIQTNRAKHNLPQHTNKGFQPLVESIACSHEHAFRDEYSGGFDVVIGNPPYVFTRELINSLDKDYFKINFKNTQFKINTYILFTEKAFEIMNFNGKFGFIIPNNWLTLETASDFRKYLLNSTFNIKVLNILDRIFETANVDTSILLFSKTGNSTIDIFEFINSELNHIKSSVNSFYLNSSNAIINYESNDNVSDLCSKISSKSILLNQIANVNNGVLAYEVGAGYPKQTKDIRDKRLYHSYEKSDNNWRKYIEGKDVQRYNLGWSMQYILYGNNLSRPRKETLFVNDRILIRQIPAQPPYSIIAMLVNEQLVNDNNSMIVSITNNDFEIKYILLLLNCKLISFWFLKTFGKLQRKLFPQFKINELAIFPIFNTTSINQQPFIEKADLMLTLNKSLQEVSSKFSKYFSGQFKIEKLSTKLEKWYNLSFDEFIKEINKAIKTQKGTALSKKDEFDWIDLFEENKAKANKLQTEIATTDKTIDAMVYELYGLTEQEIGIVENS